MSSQEKFLIGRQPIINAAEQVVAYELFFRSVESLSSAEVKSASQATASVIVNTLAGLGVKQVLGGRRGFINVDASLLMSDAIEILPNAIFGFDLHLNGVIDEQLIERCRFLKERGFVLALDTETIEAGHEILYPLVDIVKIDMMKSPVEAIRGQLPLFRSHKVKLLGKKVDSQDVFTTCRGLGFDYFQGFYFARPSVMEKKKFNESQGSILKILRLLLAEATLTEIEQVFRTSPGLTYNLLLLVNSVSFGMREKIGNVHHALSILGRQQLKRWAQLALFSSDKEPAASNPLIEMAAARATFMEQLAFEHPRLAGVYKATDQAFMVGILSLLGEIYHVSIEEVVSDLNLSDEVIAALIQRTGIYGELLEQTILIERLELGAGAIGLQKMGISIDRIIDLQVKALSSKEGMV